jgi:sulfatase maturation enzyme AslB (radical SAM superfamily)
MSIDMAKKIVDWIFDHVPQDRNGVKIEFIGGEPLLEFELIKDIFNYTCEKKTKYPYMFFATTNGTVLTDKMKMWFTSHKDCFWLGLSLDGRKETHDYNRSRSFDSIDIDFFRNNWPEQSVKMTLSEFSLEHLAEDIKFIHSTGFKHIGGVNLFEGNFNWDRDEYISHLITQLKELSSFYLNNSTLTNQMFDKSLDFCESTQSEWKKRCGIGTEPFFDVDGKRYPCAYITPMTFEEKELYEISQTNFTDDIIFVDEYCVKNCYIYPICSTCYGANYMINKNFKERNRSKCRIQKLIILFIANLQSNRIVKNPQNFDDKTVLFYTIEAIKKIKDFYFDEFSSFFLS